MKKLNSVGNYANVNVYVLVIAVTLGLLLVKFCVPQTHLVRPAEGVTLEEFAKKYGVKMETGKKYAKKSTEDLFSKIAYGEPKNTIRELEEEYGLKGTDLIVFLLWRLRADVSSIESDVSSIKSDVISIESAVSFMGSAVSSIESDISFIKSRR